MQEISVNSSSNNHYQIIPQKRILDIRVSNAIEKSLYIRDPNQSPLKALREVSFLGEDEYGRSAITLAAGKGIQSLIDCLLELGAPLEQIPPIKDFPLLAAVRMQHSHLIPYFLGLQCDVNQKTRGFMTPLLQSIYNVDLSSFSILLANGADHLFETPLGTTPLKEAVLKKSMPMISALIERGAHASTKDKTLQENAFMVAAKEGFIQALEYFNSLGNISIDEEDKHGNTALIHAVRKRNRPLIKWLIEHGADRNHVNSKGETPLIFACRMLYLSMVKTLVKSDVDISDLDGLIEKIKNFEMRRAKKNNRNPKGQDLIRYLQKIQQALNFFFPFRDSSPITYADLQLAFRDFIQNLEPESLNIYVFERPILTWAVELGFLEEVEYLLNQDADIERRDRNEMTPLLNAIEEDDLAMVELLLRYNAQVSPDTLEFAKDACTSEKIVDLLQNSVPISSQS